METMFSAEQPLGKHVIVDFWGCEFGKLDDLDLIVNAFHQAIKEAHMTLLNLSYHKFQPQGVTAVATLAESHLSIHTFPEVDGSATIDCYTCGGGDPEKAIRVLEEILQPKHVKTTILVRGVR